MLKIQLALFYQLLYANANVLSLAEKVLVNDLAEKLNL